MSFLDSLAAGFALVGNFEAFLSLFIGVVIGVIGGAIPGLSATMAVVAPEVRLASRAVTRSASTRRGG